jgi:aminoglycoside phosphotransferase (APT) family kinase protein
MTSNFGIDREVIDFAVLDRWMVAQALPGGEFERVETLAGGTQNVLIRFARGGRDYVVRRGPRFLRPRSNDQLRREARVLAALAGSDVPHPQFIAGCMDETVMNGAVFYLMEAVEGFNPTVGLPELHASSPAIRHEMGLQIADAIASLGRVDYVAAGLDGLGKPEGFLERQVPRWLSELESYRRFDAYAGPEIPDVERVAAWLDDNRPEQWTPGILHGDYHFANVLYSYDGPRLAAIVDWEMCTIGDPLLDLGWLVGGPRGGGRLAVNGGGCRALRAGIDTRSLRDRVVRRPGLLQARHCA